MDPLLGRETSCFESPCSGFADLGSISVHSRNYECPGLQTLVVLVEPPFVCAKRCRTWVASISIPCTIITV